jgi:hypothetical protein
MGGQRATARRLGIGAAVIAVLVATAFAAPSALAGRSGDRAGGRSETTARERTAPRAESRTTRKAEKQAKSRTERPAAERRATEDRQRANDRRPDSRGRAGGHNPPGNNGTIKIDGPPYDDSHGNEPHVACEFRVVFWGFDEGQRGTIEIAGHAPSGSGRVGGLQDVLISDDDAGGGRDLDAAFTFTAADLDLSGLTAHPKQGYHLKVTVWTSEPGGRKHKVLWLQPCAAPGGGSTATPTPAPTVGGGSTQTPAPTPTTGPGGSVTTTPAPGPTVGGVVVTRPGPTAPPAVAGGASGGVQPRVLGRKLTRPAGGAGALAFGGFEALGLLVVGVTLLALGVIALVAVRRRGAPGAG